MKDVNHEKLKSINHWIKNYELFNVNPEWTVHHIKAITEADDEFECIKEHKEAASMHEKQIAFLIGQGSYKSKFDD